jgi:hypothetical protein
MKKAAGAMGASSLFFGFRVADEWRSSCRMEERAEAVIRCKRLKRLGESESKFILKIGD